MGISVADNFNYQGSKFNFERDAFDTLAKMKAYPETSLPPKGFRCYCAETDKYYKFDVSNIADATTGKWREDSNENSGYSKLTWDNSTNANNIKEAGLYIIDGVHSNSGDNLPTTAYANGYIGGFMSVTVSTKDEELNEQIIGQNLTLSNKVSGETKQYVRSCVIKGDVETWSAWKEVNTIQMFGAKTSGIATKADIDAAIDNGQYAGVYMDADGFLPQGATFTLTVINNYAATAGASLPANNRQVTQIFIYTPLSTNGQINKSVMCKRDGIGGSSITWGELESVGSDVDNTYKIKKLPTYNTSITDIESIKDYFGELSDLKNAIKNKYSIICDTPQYSNVISESSTIISYIDTSTYISEKQIALIYAISVFDAGNSYAIKESYIGRAIIGYKDDNYSSLDIVIFPIDALTFTSVLDFSTFKYGYNKNRIILFNYLLNNDKELPSSLQYGIYYHILNGQTIYFSKIEGIVNDNYRCFYKTVTSNWKEITPHLALPSEERPTNIDIGFQMFDTTLNKPIWYKGENVWVDATGTEV